MVVGEKNRFAIEFEADNPPVLGDNWLYGHFCYWAHNLRIGRFDEKTSLAVALKAFEFLDKRRGKRHSDAMMKLPAIDVLQRVDRALFLDEGQSDEQVRADAAEYSRFLADLGTDVFDGWRVLLVENDVVGRLIWRRTLNSSAHECELRAGEFDKVVDACKHELECLWSKAH